MRFGGGARNRSTHFLTIRRAGTDDARVEETLAEGRYRLGRTLGKGAMGVVREATDTATGRTVAVKLVLPELAGDAVAIERFRREAVAAGALDHPSIVRVLDASDDPPFLVMERVEGEPLPRGPLPPPRAVAIATQLLAALEVAHAAGIVHRDLKPSNVLIVRDGDRDQPKILDFGIAKLTESPTFQKLTRSGERMGTPAYAAPEQMGARDVDGRADLYAVGLILHRMLTGAAPPRTKLAAALTGAGLRAPDPRDHVPSLDPRLAAIVVRATAPDRDDRFADARAMKDALAAFLVSPPRRVPAWAIAAAIGLVLALALGAWMLTRG